MPEYTNHLSRFGSSIRPNPIRKLTKLLGRGDIIALGAGAPSVETFPQEEIAEIAEKIVREGGRTALQYGPTRGLPLLLEEVARVMHGRGVEDATVSRAVITTGSQQGLDLTARLFIDPGDVVMVELPSYIGALIAFHNSGAEFIGVHQDDEGVSIDDLRSKLDSARESNRRIKLIYTTPSFQNPSGVSLSTARRGQLIEIAEEYDLLIAEDDPYGELYFTNATKRPDLLVSLCPQRVIYLSSFSKVLAPGLRTAWVYAPEEVAAKVELAKEGADISSSILDQSIVAEASRSGLIERRLPDIRRFYEDRCRAMLNALEHNAPSGTKWTRPEGGFFVLMEADPSIDATDLLTEAIESGVAYVPGQPFFVDSSGSNTLRLAFSKENPQRIAQGIETLCQILKSGARD